MSLRFATLACLLALAGCGGHGADNAQAELDLRLYAVPPDSTERVRGALERVLASEDKNRFARVSSPAQGQLLVLAPTELQGSIAAVVEALAREPKDAGKAPAQIRLHLWTVDATPGNAPDDPALQPVRAALDEVRGALGGPMQFILRDSTTAVSGIGQKVDRRWPFRDDAHAAANSINQLHYSTTAAREGVILAINVTQQIPVGSALPNGAPSEGYFDTGTETTMPVRLGQTLVLSQSSMPSAGGENKAAALTRFYIIRIDPVSS